MLAPPTNSFSSLAQPATHEPQGAMALLLAVAASGGTVQLTPATWDSTFGDKKGFVKFLAPW